jgi:hypothetical protein
MAQVRALVMVQVKAQAKNLRVDVAPALDMVHRIATHSAAANSETSQETIQEWLNVQDQAHRRMTTIRGALNAANPMSAELCGHGFSQALVLHSLFTVTSLSLLFPYP